MAPNLVIMLPLFINLLVQVSEVCSSQSQNMTVHLQGLPPAATSASLPLDDKVPCLQHLLHCPRLLELHQKPPALCCWPLIEMLANDSRCLCIIFRNHDTLKSHNFTLIHAIKLVTACGVEPNVPICNEVPPAALNESDQQRKPLPIDTTFKLPAPLPVWPPGVGFGSGFIDLGGLQVRQITAFNKIWRTYEGGPDNAGATFYEPSAIPQGFSMLGSYSQSNNMPLFGWVLVAKDVTSDKSNGALMRPVDYRLVYTSQSTGIKQDSGGYIWLPTAPDGYKAVGYVITISPDKPSLDKIVCVRSDFTDQVQTQTLIWNQGGLNVYDVTPSNRGTHSTGVRVGTFVAQIGGDSNISVLGLKNTNTNLFSSMPNRNQIESLIQAYGPYVYLHPNEEYFPASVNWFFSNGGLLYKKGEESNPVKIEPTGSNLPQGGSNDGGYWLDLPADDLNKERVKKGDLQSSKAYVHIKPMLGATFTDIVFWFFYPFNGAAKAKVKIVNINLGRLGEHVGDWEHVTLRVSNFKGELWRVYYAQHSHGMWSDASQLEYFNADKVVVYSSWHGHASYPHAGLVLQGQDGIGVRNDAAKSDMVLDAGVKFEVVAAEYLGSVIPQPPWLNYSREWGPKISYDIAEEIRKVEKNLPGFLRSGFRNMVSKLPDELLGEEGPTGPKVKESWDGDEI